MKKLLLSLLAIFLIIEEWLWDVLTALGHSLIRWLNLERLELWLSRTPPNTALLAFITPLLIVIPLNLAVLNLLMHDLIMQAILLEIVAKLLATLLVARVFALTKPQLLSFRLISLLYKNITRWLDWAHQKIIETAVYRLAKRLKAEVKVKFASWFQ